MGRKLTIGELSRRTAVSVKTLRFYSDEGLLPPAGRSRSGYRLYDEAQAARVDVIRTLREAGVSLADIGKVIRRDMPLEALLRLHLGAVEAHIAGLQRVAAAIRLAIHEGGTEEQLRRITMAMCESQEERRTFVAGFYARVVDGLPVAPTWVQGMIDASAPALTDSADALNAWVELRGIFEDPSFVACRRANAEDTFVPRFEAQPFLDAQEIAMRATSDARARGVEPSSAEAAAIVDRFADAMAAASESDARSMRDHLRAKYDPRGARHWELVSIMRGDPSPLRFDDWRWLGAAFAHERASELVDRTK